MTISWAKVPLVACRANAGKTYGRSTKNVGGSLTAYCLAGFEFKVFSFTKRIFHDEVSELRLPRFNVKDFLLLN